VKKIAITGFGQVSCLGNTIQEFLGNLRAGVGGILSLPELEQKGFQCTVGGVPKFAESEMIDKLSPIRFENKNTYIQYSMLALLEALEYAQLNWKETALFANTGVIVGTGFGAIDVIGDTLIPLVNEGKSRRIRSHLIEELMINAPAAAINGLLKSENISFGNSNACSTGGDALVMGKHWIESGLADRMIVGGCDIYSPYYWSLFDALRVTNRHSNAEPCKASRPMSESARGFVPSAGAGILIIEDLALAKHRGATIYAELIGGAMNSGGQKNGGSMTAPNPDGVVKCIKKAIANAGINPMQITLISGHLTGTKADPMEVKNWMEAGDFSFNSFPLINAPKSMIGHTLAASGAIETIAAVLQMHHRFVHPSINCEDVHPEISRLIPQNKIPQKCIENIDINYIAKASFGFGDVNSCLILKKPDK
jgi:3-oxoacyl-(acyl-carrier-protein) synthase